MEMFNIAVLGSGRGSNFVALAEYIKTKDLPISIKVVISNIDGAPILRRASEFGINSRCIPHNKFTNRDDHEKEILKELTKYDLDLIVLAGYMRIIGGEFLSTFRNKIINIHPSLLPAFKGLNAQKQAFEYGVKVTGATVHLVTEELDSGSIIDQECVHILGTDSLETLTHKILQVEHTLLPRVVERLAEEKLQNEVNKGEN